MKVAVVAVLLGALTQPCSQADESKSRTINPAKLPPNTVIIVSDKPADALNNVDAVVLTPDEYRKLLAAAEQAKRLAAPDKPEPPSVCRLSGAVKRLGSQDVALLRAEFQFRTTVPRSVVLLGLQKAQPLAATIDDGKLALLIPVKDDGGFAVQVDAAGEHRVAVELEAPVSLRGGSGSERGVELGLPGAAITTIHRLSLPADVSRVRIGGRPISARQLAAGSEKAPAVLLGPTTRLDLAWDVVPSAPIEPQTVVDGRYDVRVEDHSLVTRARMTLKSQGGPVGAWDVQAPPTAEITVEGPNPENPVRIQKPANASKPWTVRRDPSAADQVLSITARGPLTPGKPVAVPVFAVNGAAQQRGTITVAGPPNLRLHFRPGPDVLRREPGDESNHDAVFSFFRVPAEGSPLVIDVQAVRGEVETEVAHQLALAERGWRWQGKFDVRPIRTEVTAFDLELPLEWQDVRPTSAESVEALTTVREADGRKLVRVQLAEPHRKPFAFTLEALYPLAASASATSLPLPRLLGTLDRGGQLVASVPAGLELRGSYREWEGDRAGEWDRPLDAGPRGGAGLAAAVDRAPARIDLAWRTPRADVPVDAAVDIQLGERQATVRHQWRFPGSPGAPRQFVVRAPAELAGKLRLVEGGTLTATNPGEWSVQLAAPAGRETALTLAYSFPLPAGRDRVGVPVPLVWLEPCPRCETDVRMYSAATPNGELVPTGADGPWTEVPPRPVPDRPALPDLSVHGTGTSLPLTLRLAETSGGSVSGLTIDRFCVQAIVEADGKQGYRARCSLRPQQTQYVEVELPANPAAIGFTALLDGKRLPWTVVGGPASHVIRFRVEPADGGRGAVQVDLLYALSADAGNARWRLGLTSPRFRGSVFVGPVRWQIGLTADDLLLATGGDAAFDYRWGWQHVLFAPRPAWTTNDGVRGSPLDGFDTALAGWQSAAGPLDFIVVPRPVALLVGSLAVVFAGLAAVRLGPKGRFGLALVLGTAVIWLYVARPQIFTVLLYAVQPGAVVLAILLAVRWAVRQRYRRRVLFLPAFAATIPNGSGAGRNGAAANSVSREPSTIDASH
jgi:hypothetical protein